MKLTPEQRKLVEAPNLAHFVTLMKDGSPQVTPVWVHCDDSEQAYLKVMMDEVFGRDNFVACVIWIRTELPQMTADYFSVKHDFILCYRRSDALRLNGFPADQDEAAHYDKVDF